MSDNTIVGLSQSLNWLVRSLVPGITAGSENETISVGYLRTALSGYNSYRDVDPAAVLADLNGIVDKLDAHGKPINAARLSAAVSALWSDAVAGRANDAEQNGSARGSRLVGDGRQLGTTAGVLRVLMDLAGRPTDVNPDNIPVSAPAQQYNAVRSRLAGGAAVGDAGLPEGALEALDGEHQVQPVQAEQPHLMDAWREAFNGDPITGGDNSFDDDGDHGELTGSDAIRKLLLRSTGGIGRLERHGRLDRPDETSATHADVYAGDGARGGSPATAVPHPTPFTFTDGVWTAAEHVYVTSALQALMGFAPQSDAMGEYGGVEATPSSPPPPPVFVRTAVANHQHAGAASPKLLRAIFSAHDSSTSHPASSSALFNLYSPAHTHILHILVQSITASTSPDLASDVLDAALLCCQHLVPSPVQPSSSQLMDELNSHSPTVAVVGCCLATVAVAACEHRFQPMSISDCGGRDTDDDDDIGTATAAATGFASPHCSPPVLHRLLQPICAIATRLSYLEWVCDRVLTCAADHPSNINAGSTGTGGDAGGDYAAALRILQAALAAFDQPSAVGDGLAFQRHLDGLRHIVVYGATSAALARAVLDCIARVRADVAAVAGYHADWIAMHRLTDCALSSSTPSVLQPTVTLTGLRHWLSRYHHHLQSLEQLVDGVFLSHLNGHVRDNALSDAEGGWHRDGGGHPDGDELSRAVMSAMDEEASLVLQSCGHDDVQLLHAMGRSFAGLRHLQRSHARDCIDVVTRQLDRLAMQHPDVATQSEYSNPASSFDGSGSTPAGSTQLGHTLLYHPTHQHHLLPPTRLALPSHSFPLPQAVTTMALNTMLRVLQPYLAAIDGFTCASVSSGGGNADNATAQYAELPFDRLPSSPHATSSTSTMTSAVVVAGILALVGHVQLSRGALDDAVYMGEAMDATSDTTTMSVVTVSSATRGFRLQTARNKQSGASVDLAAVMNYAAGHFDSAALAYSTAASGQHEGVSTWGSVTWAAPSFLVPQRRGAIVFHHTAASEPPASAVDDDPLACILAVKTGIRLLSVTGIGDGTHATHVGAAAQPALLQRTYQALTSGSGITAITRHIHFLPLMALFDGALAWSMGEHAYVTSSSSSESSATALEASRASLLASGTSHQQPSRSIVPHLDLHVQQGIPPAHYDGDSQQLLQQQHQVIVDDRGSYATRLDHAGDGVGSIAAATSLVDATETVIARKFSFGSVSSAAPSTISAAASSVAVRPSELAPPAARATAGSVGAPARRRSDGASRQKVNAAAPASSAASVVSSSSLPSDIRSVPSTAAGIATANTGAAASSSTAALAKPVISAGYAPVPGQRRSAWWDINAQVDVPKKQQEQEEAGAGVDRTDTGHNEAGHSDQAGDVVAGEGEAEIAGGMQQHSVPLAANQPRRGHNRPSSRRGRRDLDISVILEEEDDAGDDDDSDAGDMHGAADVAGVDSASTGDDDHHCASAVPLRVVEVDDAPVADVDTLTVSSGGCDSDSLVPDAEDADADAEDDEDFEPAWLRPEGAWTQLGLGDGGGKQTTAADGLAAARADDWRVLQRLLYPPPSSVQSPASAGISGAARATGGLVDGREDILTQAKAALGVADLRDDSAHTSSAAAVAVIADRQSEAAIVHAQANGTSLACEPVRSLLHRDIGSSILQRASVVDREVVRALLDPARGDLMRHLWSLRAVLLLAEGNVVSAFTHRLFTCLGDAQQASSARSSVLLTRWLREALEHPGSHLGLHNVHNHHHQQQQQPRYRLDPSSFTASLTSYAATTPDSIIASRGIRVAYACPYPASIVVDDASLEAYNAVFSHLLRLKRLLRLLEDLSHHSKRVEERARAVIRATAGLQPQAKAGILSHMARMQHHRRTALQFVSSLHAHTCHAAVHLPWERLLSSLRSSTTLHGLQSSHADYLHALMSACFLLIPGQTTASLALDRLLTRSDTFARQCGEYYAALGSGVERLLAYIQPPGRDEHRHGVAVTSSVLQAALGPANRLFAAIDTSSQAFARQVGFSVHAAALASSGSAAAAGVAGDASSFSSLSVGAASSVGGAAGASFATLSFTLDFNGYYSGLLRAT